MSTQTQDFNTIRDKRIAIEFTQIEGKPELSQMKIQKYNTNIGMIVDVSISPFSHLFGYRFKFLS
jgi:hypothetical protein